RKTKAWGGAAGSGGISQVGVAREEGRVALIETGEGCKGDPSRAWRSGKRVCKREHGLPVSIGDADPGRLEWESVQKRRATGVAQLARGAGWPTIARRGLQGSAIKEESYR
ncbi:hypothetical protein GOP47_0013126, partial [Adiantum capillus-veneris]